LRVVWAAVIITLFGDPSRLSPVWFGYPRDKACNVLTVRALRHCVHGVVNELVYRSDMLGPSLGTGCETVAPRERRNRTGTLTAARSWLWIWRMVCVCRFYAGTQKISCKWASIFWKTTCLVFVPAL
jgi:hypothetical protein